MANEQSIFYQLGAAVKAQIASANGASGAVQEELNTTQTGAGLGTDGAYSANSSTNYLKTATSLKAADEALDSQLKSARDEIDGTQTGAGLGTDGTYAANSTTNYLKTATSLKAADEALDAQIKTVDTNKADLAGAAFTGDVSISGNLQVLGEQTVTKINQTDLDIKDNFIGLNRGASSSNTNSKDIGLYFERGSTESAGAIMFDEFNDKFVVGFLEGGVTDIFSLAFTQGMDGDQPESINTSLSFEVNAAAKTALTDVLDVVPVNTNWANETDYLGNTVSGDTISMVISSDGYTIYFTAGSGVNFLDLSSTTITLVHQDTIAHPDPLTASFSSISFEDNANPGVEYTHVSESVSTFELSMTFTAVSSLSTSGSPATGSDAATASATAAPLKVGSLEIGATVLGDLADFEAGLADE